MQFKLFNASMQQQCTTALKNAKKIQKIKKSDLNQKNLI